jgi:hypothetical protein
MAVVDAEYPACVEKRPVERPLAYVGLPTARSMALVDIRACRVPFDEAAA